MAKKAAHTVRPYPHSRLLMVDGGRLGRKKHTIHGLVEFDISHPRRVLRTAEGANGRRAYSFSAFLLSLPWPGRGLKTESFTPIATGGIS